MEVNAENNMGVEELFISITNVALENLKNQEYGTDKRMFEKYGIK